MPHEPRKTWQYFAQAVIQEDDPEKLTDLMELLYRSLAEDKNESKREPLRPKAIRARSEVRLCSRFHFKKGQRVAFAGPYDQKSFELIRAKIFSGGVTKIAVRKLAI